MISCTELTNLGDLPKILVYHFWPHEYHFGSIIVLKGHVMQVFIVFHASNFCLFLLHSNYGWRPTPYNGLISTCWSWIFWILKLSWMISGGWRWWWNLLDVIITYMLDRFWYPTGIAVKWTSPDDLFNLLFVIRAITLFLKG